MQHYVTFSQQFGYVVQVTNVLFFACLCINKQYNVNIQIQYIQNHLKFLQILDLLSVCVCVYVCVCVCVRACVSADVSCVETSAGSVRKCQVLAGSILHVVFIQMEMIQDGLKATCVNMFLCCRTDLTLVFKV